MSETENPVEEVKEEDCETKIENVVQELDEDIKKIIAGLDEEFTTRYSEDDPEYKNCVVFTDAPCIYPWYSKPKRFFDYSQRGRGRGFDRGGRGGRGFNRGRGSKDRGNWGGDRRGRANNDHRKRPHDNNVGWE